MLYFLPNIKQNNMKKLLKLLFVLAVLFSPTLPFMHRVTLILLLVVMCNKEMLTLPGASILAVHTPSGTRYTASTDYTGNFSISNMRVGGPYKVTITFVVSLILLILTCICN
jgi:ABC-type dipeptide/oligopeptide/nickel transport system permease subunit